MGMSLKEGGEKKIGISQSSVYPGLLPCTNVQGKAEERSVG